MALLSLQSQSVPVSKISIEENIKFLSETFILILLLFLFYQVRNLNVAVRGRTVKSLNPLFVYLLCLNMNQSFSLSASVNLSSGANSSSHKTTKQTKKISSHSRHSSLNTLSCFLDFWRPLLENMC